MSGNTFFEVLGRPIFRGACALVVTIAVVSSFGFTPTKGDLYFTIYQENPQNVNKIAFDFDGTKLVIGEVVNVAETIGADGLIFAPDNDILVAGQGKNTIHKINLVTKTIVTMKANVGSYHMSLDPSLTSAWVAGIPGDMAKIPLNPFGDAVRVTLQGDDKTITSLAFQDADHAFYTTAKPNALGNFGTIDMKSFTTHRILTSTVGAHGMAYDPFTRNVIIFGGEYVVQIDPATGTPIDTSHFPGSDFDQGTVDGKGHMFVADGGRGTVMFMDYSVSKKVGDPSNFIAQPFVAKYIDDVAPLSGLGSNPVIPIPVPPKPDSLLAVQNALYKDADGNGRIDQAWIEFPKANGKLPTQINLQDPFNPGKIIQVSGNKITQIDATHILVEFKDKEFASGTGFEPKPYGKLVEDKTVFSGTNFIIGDGVGPRPISVVSTPPAVQSIEKPKLTVTFSESVTVDINSKIFPFEIKRNGTDPNGKISVISVKPLGGSSYEYTFDTTFYPIPGDSIRLKKATPVIVDTHANPSNMSDYIPVSGKLLQVLYNLGSVPSAIVSSPQFSNPFALPNSILLVDPSKPQSCIHCTDSKVNEVISSTVSATPIKDSKPYLISLKANAPFHYDVVFYDNMGTCVNKAKGDLDQATLNKMEKDKEGNYTVGLFWWPVSDQGQLVGSGVYIARGTMTTSGTIQTIQGSQGQFESVTNRKVNLFFRFGYLRHP